MKKQSGVALLEALFGMVIFLIGALTMIALQANGIAAQSDAQYRIEAANRVNQIIGRINLEVTRASAAATQAALVTYIHNPGGGNCNFSGGASANATVADWVDSITDPDLATYLPGSTTAMQQILIDTATFNRVTVTVCWLAPGESVARQHRVISYIN